MIVLFNNRSEVNGLPPLPSLHESLPDVQTIVPLLNTTMKQDGGFTQSDLFWKKKVEVLTVNSFSPLATASRHNTLKTIGN